MMLLFLLLWPLTTSFLVLALKKYSRLLVIVSVIINFCVAVFAWSLGALSFELAWLPQWGAHINLKLDGLSYALIIIAHLMTLLALLCAFEHVQEKQRLFYSNLLWLLTGINGVLLSADLLLFFIFWELIILPIYLACTLWGGPRKIFASIQFLIFTQASGLLMLVSILALYFIYYNQTGVYTFDISKLLSAKLSLSSQLLIASGFLAAFLVKLPAFGLHVWMPVLFESLPVTIILLGIMIKTGAYGILRFVVPIFPDAMALMAPYMLAWGAFGILYGALLAFAQSDIRKILAFATLSHMGMVQMALFSGSAFAYKGVIILLITEALSTGALLLLLVRFGHTDLARLGGLWAKAPRLCSIGLFFILSSVGLPFLGNFVGEYMSLMGIFSAHKIAACIMALGLLLSALYYLRLMQKIFFGPLKNYGEVIELNTFHVMLFASIVGLLLFIGLYPSLLLSLIAQTTLFIE